jgi:hypothetical protein
MQEPSAMPDLKAILTKEQMLNHAKEAMNAIGMDAGQCRHALEVIELAWTRGEAYAVTRLAMQTTEQAEPDDDDYRDTCDVCGRTFDEAHPARSVYPGDDFTLACSDTCVLAVKASDEARWKAREL